MTEELKNKATEWIRSQGWNEENLPNDEYIQMCDAYVAGAKENGVIWHDLRKNPNDLPVASIFNEVLNENGNKVFYDDINKTWNMFFNNSIVRANTPNFWCEIPNLKPKFKVEE